MSHELLELAHAVREKWPFVARHARVNGWRMHYVDEGEGDPVLLLHGNPTWGYLYRDVIGPLVQSGRRVPLPWLSTKLPLIPEDRHRSTTPDARWLAQPLQGGSRAGSSHPTFARK